MPSSQGRFFCKLVFISSSSNIFNQSVSSRIPSFSSSFLRHAHGGRGLGGGGYSSSINSSNERTMTTGDRDRDDDDDDEVTNHPNLADDSPPPPPNPIPNRPLRGSPPPHHLSRTIRNNHPSSSFKRRQEEEVHRDLSPQSTLPNHKDVENMNKQQPLPLQSSVLHFLNKSLTDDNMDAPSSDVISKLGVPKKENPLPIATNNSQLPIEDLKNNIPSGKSKSETPPPPPQQDADEIFKKMKETGLIPNAVAMLDGLCKDGLVQEAMKLFGLMREKGTIPDVVIYTAVVEGFCKARKPDDAKRIFNKMLNNGISPNAFSYSVLIQGLCMCNKLEDAIDISAQMLQAGHSPNVATFVSLVHGLTREKGVEEARAVIESLRHRGFFLDEKAVREYLDKKAPSMPLVWEAIFGKKTSQSQRLF